MNRDNTAQLLLNVKQEAVDREQFRTNQEWKMTDAHNWQAYFPGKNYSFIRYHIKVERKPLFYIYSLAIPSSFVVLITIFALFNPASDKGDRKEKFRLGLSAFSSMFMLSLNVSKDLPKPGDEIPLMGQSNLMLYFS